MEQEFIIGPLQEAWLQSLEQHPERQCEGTLGIKDDDGSYKACCLGQGLIILCEHKNIQPVWKNGSLYDGDNAGILGSSWKELGLRDTHGQILNNTEFGYLTTMNDRGVSWPEIAAYIRANPTNVFTHSV